MEERVTEKQAFAQAFAALRVRDREVLALIAWDGLDSGEAAQVMGCSPATFSLRLHRARRRLVKELEASGHSLSETSN
jgi:RNA polymerase sigma-70 factor (ECF subfamily)